MIHMFDKNSVAFSMLHYICRGDFLLHKKESQIFMRKCFMQLCMVSVFIICFLGGSMKAHAETVSLPIYIETTQPHAVYAGPSTESAVIGTLSQDTKAIVYALTDNYWYQIYYEGTVGYISHENVKMYFGGNNSAASKKIAVQGAPIMINALGDSITAGKGVSSANQTYAALLGKKMGALVVRNYGLEGSCMAGAHPLRFLDRYTAMDRNANVILVFGGTNDYGFDTPLGSYGDRMQDTFYGGINQLMCGLQQMYPEADIIFMTPVRREKDGKKNKYGNTLNQYAQAVIDMANFYDFKVVDVYTPAVLNFASQKSVYMHDGIHPDGKAHAILADYVYQQLVQ